MFFFRIGQKEKSWGTAGITNGISVRHHSGSIILKLRLGKLENFEPQGCH